MTEDIQADRARIEEMVGGRTQNWSETRELALDVAAALVKAGVETGDTDAIMATKRTEHLVADMGGVHAAATPMPIYNTLSTALYSTQA